MGQTPTELRNRRQIEDEIALRERILDETRQGLLARKPLALWPRRASEAFLGALADEACPNEPEAYKARTMRAHLFRNLTVMPGEPSLVDAFAAETVRADLIRLVPLGAGAYLLPTVAEAAE